MAKAALPTAQPETPAVEDEPVSQTDIITLEDGSTHEIEYVEKGESGYIISPREARRQFDAMAREFMGMSGEVFLRRWDAGEFDDLYDKPGHWQLGDLIGFRPIAEQKS